MDEVESVLTDVMAWFPGKEHQALRRDMATWMLQVLFPSRFPGLAWPDSMEDLAEMMKSLLAERAKKWPQQWMEKGRQEGQARQLLLQLEQKFGALPKVRRQEVASADVDVLLEWAGRILNSDNLEQVFDGHGL